MARVTIYLNDGRGQLTRGTDVTLGSADYASRLFAVDFDHDGALDLVSAAAAEWPALGVGIIRGRGDGTFVQATRAAPLPGVMMSQAEDLDGDGIDEVVAIRHGTLSVGSFHGGGELSFADTRIRAAERLFAIGDRNVRGVRTIFTASSTDVRLYSRDSGGTWVQIGAYPYAGTLAMAAGDVVAGGRGELLLVTRGQSGTAFLRVIDFEGRQVFLDVMATSDMFWIETADVDGDGHDDILLAASGTTRRSGYTTVHDLNGFVALYRGLGDRKFASGERVLDGVALATGPRSADFNGDGRDEVVVATRSGQLFLLTSDADRTIVPSRLPGREDPADAGVLLVADVNGDGLDDLLSGSNTLYQGTPQGPAERGSFLFGPASDSRVLVRRSRGATPTFITTAGGLDELLTAQFVCEQQRQRSTRP